MDSYVQLRCVTVDSSKKTFSFAHKINLVTLVRTVTKTVLIRATKTASLYINPLCYPLDIVKHQLLKSSFVVEIIYAIII